MRDRSHYRHIHKLAYLLLVYGQIIGQCDLLGRRRRRTTGLADATDEFRPDLAAIKAQGCAALQTKSGQ
jgi:hypothetical protein